MLIYNLENLLVSLPNRAGAGLIDAIVREIKKTGGFTLPSFGTFTAKKTKARKAVNPPTGEPIKVKAGKTVRSKLRRTWLPKPCILHLWPNVRFAVKHHEAGAQCPNRTRWDLCGGVQ